MLKNAYPPPELIHLDGEPGKKSIKLITSYKCSWAFSNLTSGKWHSHNFYSMSSHKNKSHRAQGHKHPETGTSESHLRSCLSCAPFTFSPTVSADAMNAFTSFLCELVLPEGPIRSLSPKERNGTRSDMTEHIHPESLYSCMHWAPVSSNHLGMPWSTVMGRALSSVVFSQKLYGQLHHKGKTSNFSKWSSILHNTKLASKRQGASEN